MALRRMLETTMQDLRFGARALRRRPGFTLAAVLTLGLGVGANTAVFSVVDAVLLRPLPYRAPESLVRVWPAQYLAQREVEYLRGESRELAAVASYSPGWLVGLTEVAEPTQLNGARVSGNLFEMLGVQAAVGRAFDMAAELPGNDAVVVLSWELWQDRFGGDPSWVGRSIRLDGTAYQVVGVMPRRFQVQGESADLWLPLAMDPTAMSYAGSITQGLGRLRPGATPATARTELRTLVARMRTDFGMTAEYGTDADVIGLKESIVGGARPMLLAVFASVTLLLLIAAANVANLVLVQASGRQLELAVRASLGADRSRLARQLITESVLLGLAGAACGVLFAVGGVALLRGLVPPGTPRLAEVAVNMRLLTAGLAFGCCSMMVFGIVPAFIAARGSLERWLRRARVQGGAAARARGILVSGEVALSVVLLLGAALMLRTVQSLERVDAGFDAERVLTLNVQPTFTSMADYAAYWQELLPRVRAVPGVVNASTVLHAPMSGRKWQAPVTIEGRPLEPGAEPPRTAWQVVSPGYFETLRIRVLAGRAIDESDRTDTEPSVVVNEVFARMLFGAEDPLGRRIQAGNATSASDGQRWFTIVGVVRAVLHDSLTSAPPPEIYVPVQQRRIGSNTLVVRTSGDPMALAGAVQRAVWALDADVPIAQVRTLADIVTASTAARRLVLRLLGAFAVVGILLGVVGIWGVVAHAVRAGTRELGIRMALGATPRAAMRRVMGAGARYAALGLVIGLALAWPAVRLLRSLLFGVEQGDPLSYGAALALMGFVTLLASWLPARRALRLPLSTLLRE